MYSEIQKNNIENQNPKKENYLWELVKFVIFALVIVVPIRVYIAQPFMVDGPSMDPTFATRQYLIVDQISYRFNEPKRNDVIVFRYPLNPKLFYIKRIIGLPGDTVSAVAGKITIVNSENPSGFAPDDGYIADGHRTNETFKTTLGSSEYFVMGDNRSQSADSRLWGPVDRKYIVGRTLLRLLPVTKVALFPGRQ